MTIPTGRFISPGPHSIHTVRVEEEEVWWMGNLLETIEHEIHEIHLVIIPDPGFDGPEDDENSWPVRGEFNFADRTFAVIRDDDIGFWGFKDGAPLTKQDFLARVEEKNRQSIETGRERGWWDIDAQGNPTAPALKVSKSQMEAENKPLMAHLMVDLGLFPSVGQAKKNGWDKPLEIGQHTLGPKKKRINVEILP